MAAPTKVVNDETDLAAALRQSIKGGGRRVFESKEIAGLAKKV